MTTHSDPTEHGWRVTASRTAYENPWIRVREDDVVRPDGSPGLYGVVELRRPAVFVVAVDEHDRVLLETLYRYATEEVSIEVPSGGADDDDPLTAARRELMEETGFEADEWTPVGRMNQLNGICRAAEHVFVARGLRRSGGADDLAREQQVEGISDVRWVPWAEVMRMVKDGEITDGETVGALMFAALHLGRVS